MKRDKPLPPKLAALMFAKNPSSIEVRLSDLLDAFDLELVDIMPDLRSGRLIAHLERAPRPSEDHGVALRRALRRDEIWFSGQALLDWVATRQ